MTTFQVYRFWDADGALLYVGCTSNWELRRTQHRSSAPWFAQAARCELDEPLEKRDAFKSERTAIETEAPLYNHRHSQSWAAIQPRDPNLSVFTGNEVRSLREAAGESLEAMARSLGIVPGCLWQFETGRKTPTIATAGKIATHLGVSYSVVALGGAA